MKYLTKLLLFSLLFSGALITAGSLSATEINFSQVEIYSLENNTARLKWNTYPDETKAMVYYGEFENDLNRSIGYAVYANQHEVKLSGLEKDKTYYFKILAWNRSNQPSESFLQTFSTRAMKDTLPPDLLGSDFIQITKDAAVFYWLTNEKTRAALDYGYNYNEYQWHAGTGDLKREHDIFLYNLDTDQKYYLKLTIEDEAGNKKTTVTSFRSSTLLSNKDELSIYDIAPQSRDQNLIKADSAALSWKTNFAGKSKIFIGTQSDRYDQQLEVTKELHKLTHQIKLNELVPRTTYYYKIEVYDALYGKSKQSRELTFATPAYSSLEPNVIPNNSYALLADTDHDQLSDSFEYQIGTDPLNWDSDADGYSDGNEFIHGYDPLVPGSSAAAKLQARFYRLPKRNADYEARQSNELKTFVHNQLGPVNISTNNWQTLANAYIYGRYPAYAITQAIRFGGKTVHPTINWTAWQTSPQYQTYINR